MSHSHNHFQRMTHMGDLSIQDFIDRYWQRKPLLIKNAFPGFTPLISADELAGLSLEDCVESRLIVQQGQQWDVKHGPLDDTDFEQLPEALWTLLVQHVDQLSPPFNALLNAFRFIPDWRLDDIMVSYATDGGGVGPHFDYYDVFLLQAQGQRRWRIGQQCSSDSPLVRGQSMKILEQFDTQEDWIVTPGDLLYIPAKTAHWGEAIGECMTYSIGFRAPSHSEFLLDYSQELASHLGEDARYSDPSINSNAPSSRIDNAAIQQFQTTLDQLAGDTVSLARWLGEYSTRLHQEPEVDIEPATEAGKDLVLSPYARAAYYALEDGRALFFCNGESWETNARLAEQLCQRSAVTPKGFNAEPQLRDDLLEREQLLYAGQ